VTAQSVEIDGIPVPRMALEYFVSKYLTSRFPKCWHDLAFQAAVEG
jgi:hypothetical protein